MSRWSDVASILIDVALGWVPGVGGTLQGAKALVLKMNEAADNTVSGIKLDIRAEDTVDNLKISQKFVWSDGSCKEVDSIYLKFNKALSEDESAKFYNTDSFEDAYSNCDVTMKRLTDDDGKGVYVYFDETVSEFEIARFAVMIDRYIQDINSTLNIESVEI